MTDKELDRVYELASSYADEFNKEIFHTALLEAYFKGYEDGVRDYGGPLCGAL